MWNAPERRVCSCSERVAGRPRRLRGAPGGVARVEGARARPARRTRARGSRRAVLSRTGITVFCYAPRHLTRVLDKMRVCPFGVTVFVALALVGLSPARGPFAHDSTQSTLSVRRRRPPSRPCRWRSSRWRSSRRCSITTTQTSSFSPPSPDPSGLTFDPSTNRLIIVDGEVEEMAIFAGVNLYAVTLGGSWPRPATPWISIEPVGLAFNTLNKTVFVSDDDAREVYEVAAGSDGQHGTSDERTSRTSTPLPSAATIPRASPTTARATRCSCSTASDEDLPRGGRAQRQVRRQCPARAATTSPASSTSAPSARRTPRASPGTPAAARSTSSTTAPS